MALRWGVFAIGFVASVGAVVPAAAAAAAQPEARTISLGFDLGLRSARDDLIVPIASTGPYLGLGGRFLGVVGRGLVDTGIRLKFGALFDRDWRPAAGISHALRIAYLPIVRRSRSHQWSLAAGPLLAWQTDVLWLAKWDDAHAYWTGRRFLGVAARAWRPLPARWRVDVSADINVVGLESRPPAYRYNVQDGLTRFDYYLASVNRDARFGSVLEWQTLRLEADFTCNGDEAAVPSGPSLGIEARLLHTERPAMAFLFELGLRLIYGWEVR